MPSTNGLACIMANSEWTEYKEKTNDALEKVEDMHANISQILKHSENLSALPEVKMILSDIKTGLIGPATSKRQVDNETFMMVVKTLAGVIIGLVLVIVYLTTGHFGLQGK